MVTFVLYLLNHKKIGKKSLKIPCWTKCQNLNKDKIYIDFSLCLVL